MPYKDPQKQRERAHINYVKHRDARIARSKKWVEEHPEQVAVQYHKKVLKKYGLTPEEYAAKLKQQNNVCAICGQPEQTTHKGKLRRLSVDHNHDTGLVRDLLCMRCNALLGHAADDIDHLLAAVQYLRKHSN
jgi:hypothetical protein